MTSRLPVLCVSLLCALVPLASQGSDEAEASLGDNRFLAGDDVGMSESVDGNAFVAGGRARVDGRVGGHAIVAGGVVEIRGDIDEGVLATGGDVGIDANVRGDVLAAGGTISIERDASVRGSATLAGGSVDVNGRVGGKLRAFGGSVRLDGEIGGDAEVAAEDIQVGPQARISGRLRYRGPNPPQVAEGAVIDGGVERARHAWQGIGGDGRVMRAVARVFRVLWFTGVLALGALLVLVLPRFTQEAAATVRNDAPASLGLGVAVLVLVPVLAAFLCLTIIGIPLAFAVLLGYGLLLMLGFLTGALFVGDSVLGIAKPANAESRGWRILFLLLALIAIAFMRRLPWVGELAVLALFLAGLGAFTLRSFRGYQGTTT